MCWRGSTATGRAVMADGAASVRFRVGVSDGRIYEQLADVQVAPAVNNTTSADYINGVRATLQLGANTDGEYDGDLVNVAVSAQPPEEVGECRSELGQRCVRVPLDDQEKQKNGKQDANVCQLPPFARKACERAGLTPADLAAVVLHQANLRIIELMAKRLKLPERTVIAPSQSEQA